MAALSQRPRRQRALLVCLVLGGMLLPVVETAAQSLTTGSATPQVYPDNPGSAVTTSAQVTPAPRLLLAPAPNEVVPANGTQIQTPAPLTNTNALVSTPVPTVPMPLAPDAVRHPLTMDEAITLAFQRSPDLQIALSQLEKTRGGIEEARSHTRPTVSAQGSTSWQGYEQSSPIQSSGITPQVSATLTIPLDWSRQLKYASDLAMYQYQSQYFGMVATAEQLVLAVKSAYFDLLRAVGQGKVAQAAVDNAQAQLTQIKDKFAMGTIPAFDVTSAEVNLANLQQQLLVADSQVRVAQTALNRVLGIDVNTPIQIRGVDITVLDAAIDIPQQIRAAYARRPEVQAVQLGITQVNTSVDVQQRGAYPTFSVSAGPTYTFNPDSVNAGWSWQVGLNAGMPLIDGGQIRAKVRQARADVHTSQETMRQTQLAVAQDVRTAALNVQQAAERTKSTARAVSLAEEAFSLAKLRYGAGLAVLVEVTNAETQLTQARNNAVNALYDYAVASAQLQRATSTQPELARWSSTAGSPTPPRQ